MNEKVLERKEKFFWLVNGKGVRSLRELADAFPTISEEEFSHHVTPEKNDFADWIRDVFAEYQLSERLRRTKTRAAFQSVLYNAFARKTLFKSKAQPISKTENAEVKEVENDVGQKEPEVKEPEQNDEPDVINNPEEFIKYHEKDAELKDKMADRFDAFATKFEESLNPETPLEIEKRIEKLEERYKELHSRIAEARKLGKDLLIADFTLRPALSKMKYAGVTHQEKDFVIVENIFAEVEKEITDALAFEEPNAKKEVDDLVEKGQRPIAIEQTPNPQSGGNA